MFNKKQFLDLYKSNSDELVFLTDFVERPAFTDLVEHWTYDTEQVDTFLFKKRLDELQRKPQHDEADLASDREKLVISVCPFFDLLEKSRDISSYVDRVSSNYVVIDRKKS